jgi:hypothetical protein
MERARTLGPLWLPNQQTPLARPGSTLLTLCGTLKVSGGACEPRKFQNLFIYVECTPQALYKKPATFEHSTLHKALIHLQHL